jgi:hypothetical protein
LIEFNENDDEFDALEVTIRLGGGLFIDGYLFPNGTLRYGLSQISVLLGYESKYYSQVVRRRPKKLKALQGKGFTGGQLTARVKRLTGGITRAKTFDFDDFCLIVEFEAVNVKNPKAIALLTASFREFLRSRTLEAFGIPDDTLELKQFKFWESFQEREAAWIEDRQDLDNLWLPGDEMYFPDFVDWQDECESKYFEQKAEYLLSQ